jgi:hypothetical protein
LVRLLLGVRQVQPLAMIFAALMGIPAVGYGAWFWYRHADWIATPAAVKDCGYRHGSDWSCTYVFSTPRGHPIEAAGTWGEDVLTRAGEARTIFYDPVEPARVIDSKTYPLVLWGSLTLAFYLAISIFYGGFFARDEHHEDRLQEEGREVTATLVAMRYLGFNGDFLSRPHTELRYLWRDPDSGQQLEFLWSEPTSDIEARPPKLGSTRSVRFVPAKPTIYELGPLYGG